MEYSKVTIKAMSNIQKPTTAMINYFLKRNAEHIEGVRLAIKEINKLDININQVNLSKRGIKHDASKTASDIEYLPYVWITESHRPGSKYSKLPESITKYTDKAWQHHCRHNRHHPGYYKSPSLMTNEDIGECCADLISVGHEMGNKASDYFKQKLSKEHKFDSEQLKLINKIFKELEE